MKYCRSIRRLAQAGIATIVCWAIVLACSPLLAVPHEVSRNDHPFDPDWLLVKRMLEEKCLGCHRPGGEESDLANYAALMSHKDVVVPGKLEDSMLWDYCAWNVTADSKCKLPEEPMMPPDRHEWLTAGQMETLRRWILNGALEYKLPQTCNIRPLLETDFPSAKTCGACHPKQFEEWSRSMHAYAQHSPVFEAFNLTLEERTSGTIGTFCTRCHTPIGTMLGENGVRRNVHRSRISMESVTCVVCHRRASGHYKSSGRLPVAPGDVLDTCVFGPFDNSQSGPLEAHPAQQLPYIKSSQFCGECHDVFSPDGVRNEEAFSEYLNSPAAKDGITCQQCHMGPVQGRPHEECERPLGRAAVVPGLDPERLPLRRLSDHTFAGPDYSLLPDTEFPHKLDWMYETDYRDRSALTPHQQRTLDELRRKNRKQLRIANEKRYELLSNAAKLSVEHAPTGRRFTALPIRVNVVSTTAGHSVPTGFTAERQVWVSVEVRDPRGKVVFASGDLDSNTDLRDAHSHEVLTGQTHFDHHLLNFQNKFTALTHKGTERTVVISVNRDLAPLSLTRPATVLSQTFGRPTAFRIAKGSLPPLRTMGQTYPAVLGDCAGRYQIDARLNFRHLPPALLDKVGVPHLKKQLEIVVIDRYVGYIDAY